MAQKSMADYVWLADTLAGYTAQAKQYGIPEYGLTLSKIKELYKQRDNLYRTVSARDTFNDNSFAYWRVRLWFYFGLIVEYVHAKGYEHRYRLINPELLTENKTLRELMLSLVKDDESGSPDITIASLNKDIPSRWREAHPIVTAPKLTSAVFTDVKAMHSIVAGEAKWNINFASRIDAYSPTEDDEEMLARVEFSMMMGESLVLKISKDKNKQRCPGGKVEDEKSFKYIFEPQAIKEIDYRWYVLGLGYFADNPDMHNFGVFDIKDLVLFDDDSEPIPYELEEDFKLENYIPEWDSSWEDLLLELRVSQWGRENRMFCPLVPASSQNRVMLCAAGADYIIYTKPSKDFLIKYLAYFDFLSVDLPEQEHIELECESPQYRFIKYLKKAADYWRLECR